MKPEPTIRLGTPPLEMHGVSVSSIKNPGAIVVSNVNWTVNAGETWVVAGAQRTGKTDFLMMTGGLMPPAAGSYRFAGTEMPIYEDDQLPERLKIGFVFDGGQLFNRMTVAENVTLPLRYHQNLPFDEAQQRLQPLLKTVGLERVTTSRPTTLGRNFQKRVGLARALALRPEVLLLDNPLAGLDAHDTDWWLDFLGQLSQGHELTGGKAVTLVVTTDDLRPWRGGGQHFACLAGEQFHVLGGWEEVTRNQEAAVKNLLRERLRDN